MFFNQIPLYLYRKADFIKVMFCKVWKLVLAWFHIEIYDEKVTKFNEFYDKNDDFAINSASTASKYVKKYQYFST